MYRFIDQVEKPVKDWYLWTQAGRSPIFIKPEAEHLDSLLTSVEITEFLRKHSIKDDVVKTLALAREHFSVLGDPRYEIIEDLESQECYLAIHVDTAGGPEEVFKQSESFLDAFVTNIYSGNQRHISLVYHST